MPPIPVKGKKPLKTQLKPISEDLAIHGIHVNLLAVRQEVQSGTLPLKTVVGELLDLKKSDVDALENGRLGGLSKDLDDVVKDVGNVCGPKGDNCRGLETIKAGITAMESIDPTALNGLQEVTKVGSSLQVLLKVKLSSTETLIETLTKLKNFIANPPGDTSDGEAMDSYRSSVKYGPSRLLKGLQSFSTKFTDEDMKMLTEESLKSAVDKVLDAKPVSDLLKAGGAVDLMKKQLDGVKGVTSQLNAKLPNDLPKNIGAKVATLSEKMERPKLALDEKTATHGFHRGFDDLKNVPINAKSSFVKNSGTDKQGEKILEDVVAFAALLEKNVEPFLKISQPDGAVEAIQLSKQLAKRLELAVSEITELSGFTKLQECVELIDGFTKDVDMKKWLDEKKYIDDMKPEAVTYAEAFNNVKVTTTEIENFKKAVESVDLKVQPDFVSTYSEKDALLKELNQLSTELANIDIKTINNWIRNSEIVGLMKKLQEWLNKKKMEPLQDCFKAGGILEVAKKLIGDRSEMSAVLDINSGNKNIVGAHNLEKMVLELANAWNQKFASKAAIPITGDAPMLPDALKISHDVNAAIKYLLDLVAAAEEQFNLEEFERNEKTVLALFDALQDARKQEFTDLWRAEMIRIKILLEFLGKANQIEINEPRHLSDYKEVFTAVGDLEGLSDHQLKELVDACIESGSSFPSKKVRDRLDLLDLNFANGQMVMRDGSSAFNSTIPYFVDPVSNMFAITPNFTSTSSLPPTITSGFGTTGIVLTAVGSLAVLGTGFGIYKWKNSRGAKHQDNGNVPVFRGDDGSVYFKVGNEKRNYDDCDVFSNEKPRKEVKATVKHSKTFMSAMEAQCQIIRNLQKKLQDIYDNAPYGTKKEPFMFPTFTEEQVGAMMDFDQLDVVIDEDSQHLNIRPAEKEYLVGKGTDLFECDPKRQNEGSEDVHEPLLENPDNYESERQELVKKIPAEVQKLAEIFADKGLRESAGEESKVDVKPKPRKWFGWCRSKKEDSDGNLHVKETLKEMTDEDYWEWCVKTYTVKDYEEYVKRRRSLDPPKGTKENEEQNRSRVSTNNTEKVFGYKINRQELGNRAYVRKLITEMLRKRFIEYEYPYLDYKEYNKNPFPLELFTYHFAPSDLEWIIKEATQLFKDDLKDAKELEDGKRPTITLSREDIMEVGDIHGQYRDLLYHLTLEFMNKDITFVFLGDFPDRGPRSMDCIILLCLLKLGNRRRFYWLRGNHETGGTNTTYGFLLECRRNLGHWCGTEFWILFNKMFDILPIYGTLQGRVFVAHGGMPREMIDFTREDFANYVELRPTDPLKAQIQLHILWIDPAFEFALNPENPTAYLAKNDRGMQGLKSMSEVGLDAVMKKHNYVLVIRGHQAEMAGMKLFNGIKFMTIFGSTKHFFNNKAMHAITNKSLDVRIRVFNNISGTSLNQSDVTQKSYKKKKVSK